MAECMDLLLRYDRASVTIAWASTKLEQSLSGHLNLFDDIPDVTTFITISRLYIYP